MAGVLDLKGRVIRKNNAKRATQQIVLIVESMQHNVVRELGRLTGTAPEVQKLHSTAHLFVRKGCVEHCPDSHVHVEIDNIKPIVRWTITGTSMGVVLWNLESFLCNGSDLLVAMNETLAQATLAGRGAAATVSSLRRLQRLGWDMPPQILEQMEVFDARATGAPAQDAVAT
jgi:hypothetical protein